MHMHRNRHHCTTPRDPHRHQRHEHDKAVFHALLDRHQAIERTLEKRPDGIRSLTRSDDPEVVALLHDHVPSMHERLLQGFALRRWDPLYVAIFEYADAIDMDIRLLPDGVEVTETSQDPSVVPLLHAHGEAVDAFVRAGHIAASQPAPFPRPTQPQEA